VLKTLREKKSDRASAEVWAAEELYEELRTPTARPRTAPGGI